MITRLWILWVVVIIQGLSLGTVMLILFGSLSLGIDYGLLADIGGFILVFWVSISHLLLLRKYLALKAENHV
jgi:hypothetical protein